MSIFNSTASRSAGTDLVIERIDNDERISISYTLGVADFVINEAITSVKLYKGVHQYTIMAPTKGRQIEVGISNSAFVQVTKDEFYAIAKAQGISLAKVEKWENEAKENG